MRTTILKREEKEKGHEPLYFYENLYSKEASGPELARHPRPWEAAFVQMEGNLKVKRKQENAFEAFFLYNGFYGKSWESLYLWVS